MFKRIVDAVEIAAAVCAGIFVVFLFIDDAPGTKAASTATTSPYGNTVSTVAASPDGAAVYARACSSCHGSTGQGGVAPRLAGTVATKFKDKAVQALIIEKGSGRMPAFESTLTKDEIDAVVDYTRSLK